MSSRVLDALHPPKLRTTLRSGHAVVVTGDERVEVRDAHGDVQVTIVLDGDVPTVRLTGARLELESLDTVAVTARVFEVRATERVDLRSDGDLELASGKAITLLSDDDLTARAPCIWLN